jgi:arylsulfatase A-like enzyme
MLAVCAAGLCLGAGALGAGTSPTTAGPGDARPNVVVIQADDQTVEMMRVMSRTNRLLGERGATFRNHFANWPVCCPSRATQLTGQYAHNHGVLGNSPPEGSYLRFDRDDNLAVWLAEAGYLVGHVGKFLNGYGPTDDRPETPYNDVTEVPPGWTDWLSGSAGDTYQFYAYTQNEWSGEAGDPRDGELVEYGNSVADFKTDVNTDDALSLIRDYSDSGDPFYLQLDYLAPHGGGPRVNPQPPANCRRSAKPAPRHAHAFDDEPLPSLDDPSFNEADVSDKPPHIAQLGTLPPDEIAEVEGRYECRLESILAIDEGVEQVVELLRRRDELANTYVFYTSDNGFFHGEHRIRLGKNDVYEPSIRIPLLMRGPEVPAGARVRDLTINADLATTIMEVTGAEPGAGGPDGVSLLRPATRPREETGRELLLETLNYTAVRTQRYKFVEYTGGFTELYDLKRDPFEEENASGEPSYAEVEAALAARLDDLRNCAGDDCRLTPDLELQFRPLGGNCVSGPVRVSAVGADEEDVVDARALSRGKLADVDREAPIELKVSRKELKGQGRAEVRAHATLLDGRRVVETRSFAVCR